MAAYYMVIIFSVAFIWVLLAQFGSCADDCQQIAPDEVVVLRNIALELGKKDWNFKEAPCTNQSRYTSWYSESVPARPTYVNQVTCNCFSGRLHVVNISLKGQDLSGVLPKSLAKLRYLTTIDLSRNLLRGPIPLEWATSKLQYMSLMANQLSGPIPKYLGNITTLEYLSIESNSFSGAVPAEIGNLVNLRNLTLSDNNLTGNLPSQMKSLENLTELRISSVNFSGRIPDYFQSWTNLQKLEIQGSGFEGPIPSSISRLTDLVELRISDLNGQSYLFPSLENLTQLVRLMLRSCKLYGPIPTYIAETFTNLKILDLSFNKLNGSIPNSLQFLPNLQSMYLNNNMLSGSVYSWIISKDGSSFIDLSYNSLTQSSGLSYCNRDTDTVNLYRSFSSQENLKSGVCQKDFHCKARYSLHINCGGKETTIGKTLYDPDEGPGGAAKLVATKAGWGFSSSGDFWFRKNNGNYIAKNSSILRMNDSELYMDARLSAAYLTYFSSCLGQGNYSVALHFSEIVFGFNSFSSLGRRLFDIYIQDKLVYKDFNIVKEANGTNRAVKKVFNHVPVSSTFEVRLYYAGKGSTGIPLRGTYGPLISAISVEPEFKPPADRKKTVWAIVGATASFVSLAILLFLAYWRRRRAKGMISREQDLAGLDLQAGLFTYRQIKAATNSFDPGRKIGEGGFGSVYLGTLLDGTHIAVKQLSSRSKQGNREFINEIGIISGLHHPNLVKLYGCCVEGNQLFLIYEYMENNNLARALYDNDQQAVLNWPVRLKICIGIVRGLTFLHEESIIKIVHRDIKATNVLLDRDLNAKISDFGLARLDEEEETHISTRVAGTIGYMAPEYALWGYLTFKADVYSFGVLALEIVAGRSNTKYRPDENCFCLLDRAFVLQQQKGNLMELVDPRLGDDYNKEEALRMIRVALICTNPSPAVRPTMSEVLSMLQGNLVVKELTLEPTAYNNDWLYQASRRNHDLMSENETQSLIDFPEAPKDDSSP